jgi:hypothetical protein
MTVTRIKVTHIGEDYGKVEVLYIDGHTTEYEVDRSLAEALQSYLNEQRSEARRSIHNAYNNGFQNGKAEATYAGPSAKSTKARSN